jgi:hypothetical protein
MRGEVTMSLSSTHKKPPVEKMPGHWVLSRMGKRVLRPGGLELTKKLLSELKVSASDDVVEFAPGLGVTARMTLAKGPHSYTAIERDRDAADTVSRYLSGSNHRCVLGNAEGTGLADASATIVYGEAMLSMQPASTKERIVNEAARVLQIGGRYGIHELCLVPDDVDESVREAIRQELSDEIHVGVRPLTIGEWRELLTDTGFKVLAQHTAPMHLLEPRRLIKDEGFLRALRFAWNVATHDVARKRVLRMRRTFRKFRDHLAAVIIVGQKAPMAKGGGDRE